jgi:hypothetical protein
MATQMHPLELKRIDEAEQVAHKYVDRIVPHRARSAAAPVAALIGHELTDTSTKPLSQRPPAGRMVGKAVQHQERRALSPSQIVELYPVRCDAVLHR